MIDLFLTRAASARRHHRDLVSQFDPLLELMDDPEALDRRNESISAWSVGQQLEHIAKVDAGIFERIQQLLADPSEGQGGPIPLARALLLFGRIARGKGRSPEQYLATGVDADDVRSMLETCKLNWQTFEPRLGELVACRSKARHPLLGAFTTAQWVRFEQIHVRHHRQIIDDILTS